MTIRTTDTLDEGRVIFREPKRNEERENPAEQESTAQVTDPVCGMDVAPQSSSTQRAEHDGTTYYFCSTACKETFVANPEQFIVTV